MKPFLNQQFQQLESIHFHREMLRMKGDIGNFFSFNEKASVHVIQITRKFEKIQFSFTNGNVIKKIWSFLKNYPIPVYVLAGLILGIVVFFFDPNIAHWIWFAILILGGIPIVYQTIKGMLNGKFAADIVASLAIITAVILGQAFAGAIVVLMQSGGEAIEAYGLRRASSSLKALLERAPRIAWRKKESQLEEISVEKVAIGDILIVRPGDLVPVDGTIIKGDCEIDDSAITGEPFAKRKTIGDPLLSGSVDTNGAIEMRADKISSESQYAKIVLLVKQAQEQKAPIQRLADRYAIFFTPLTLLMCLIGFFITKDFTTILSVLVVATPCPLILATPIAVISGINRASDAGIIVKGGAPIEQIANAQAALFDKTGTITFGTPIVEKVVSLEGNDEDLLLYHAAILEQLSAHSIAKAIVAKAWEKSKQLPLPEQFQEIVGKGIEGMVEGDHYMVGSSLFFEEKIQKGFLKNFEQNAKEFYAQNKLLVFVAKNGRCIGFIVLSDHIREEAPLMIQKLRDYGIKKIVMVTGDSKKNAEGIAKEAGFDAFEAELLPENKVKIVQEYKRKYDPLIMVGDGINDAPALATATVGVAMGAYGTAISAEAADIVLLVDDLSKVSEAVAIGKRMLYIAKQSIFIGIGLSFLLMIVAAFGYILPAVGASLQELIDVAVILNALRARK